ncbi:hypothetical protein [Ferrimonas marina]|uniref:hypothetical protein n=1 Tax=Ferrimonas marina TaxID=299255 RepID=UPI00082E14E8|nr:hypothetical protein [Ferrimonas marina]
MALLMLQAGCGPAKPILTEQEAEARCVELRQLAASVMQARQQAVKLPEASKLVGEAPLEQQMLTEAFGHNIYANPQVVIRVIESFRQRYFELCLEQMEEQYDLTN